MAYTVYIGIGSNLGDRAGNCEKAVALLGRHNEIEVLKVSKWRETKALTRGNGEQPLYINGAVKISTRMNPRELLSVLQSIEAKLGRPAKREKWAPRTIDLDILYHGDAVVNEPDLVIPHPEILKRKFVMEPLCDIEPTLFSKGEI